MVIVSTLRLAQIHLILDGTQVVCHAGATLYGLEQALAPLGRDPHSVIGPQAAGWRAGVVRGQGLANFSGSVESEKFVGRLDQFWRDGDLVTLDANDSPPLQYSAISRCSRGR
ncbi:hypothetical protein DPM13_16435 [Paracoccus mutanolyticus]|uniref:FAD linked oxidase N-terminal domain-containing protein n=1 Tax=Paracoccus mutanolyticus TaxID=1499308 RepID=A0ABN5M7U2_9RHOB|nr:hypothetical protein [Paracoccus mutanolyticus]AWX94006.1 hypothetical protein DPM13_16435 [Paracoccus mutanolyticus]